MTVAPTLPFAIDRLRNGPRVGLRHVLDGPAWDKLAADPPHPGSAPLLGLWADGDFVNALFHEGRHRPVVTAVAAEGLRYRGLSLRLPAAIPYERRIRDLHGLEAMFAADLRPLLDHGAWASDAPLARHPGPASRSAVPVEWLDRDGADDGLVHVEQGPIGGPLPGMRLRATLAGSTVRRAEIHHGFLHRGLVAACAGRTVAEACRIAGRVDAMSGVAHALAFSRAVEQALGVVPTPRVVLLRVLAVEAEHAASGATLIARGAEAVGSALFATKAAALASFWRDVNGTAFGHRFASGFVVPGGVARPLGPRGGEALGDAVVRTARETVDLARLYESVSGPARALGSSGVVSAVDAIAFSSGGAVARASGLGFDLRHAAGSPVEPFASVPSTTGQGTADARYRLRLAGLGQSASRIRLVLGALGSGEREDPVPSAALPPGPGDGIGGVEGPDGDIWHVVSLDADLRVTASFIRDPAVAHAALFERAVRNASHDLLPAIAHSFGLRAEAIDL